MTNAILQVLLNILLVFSGAVVFSIIGVSALLGLDYMWKKWKERKKK